MLFEFHEVRSVMQTINSVDEYCRQPAVDAPNLPAQMDASSQLKQSIKSSLKGLGYGLA